ncbi:MAG: universal stress protein [Dehalococcoidales bacterium]|nr:universal stress protein [Dehalococcoidales bacterium]
MERYKNIVVPLDGSTMYEVALPYAEELAGKLGLNIVLLTVLDSEEPEQYASHATYAKKIVDVTRRQVDKYLKDSDRASLKIDIGSATRSGSPAEGILDYINKGTYCLVVMATHGRSGIGRWAIGSVADKIVRATSRQPLLLIRAKGNYADVRAKRLLKKVLVPLDGSAMSESVVPFVAAIAAHMDMQMTFLITTPNSNGKSREAETCVSGWCEAMMKKGITCDYEVRIGTPADEIIGIADEKAFDLVAMTTRGQSAVNLWSLGSVTQKVLLGGTTPLMLVRN